VPDGQSERNELLQVVEAADRAGAIVTDQVRSIIEAAETKAQEIERNAEQEAGVTRQAASEAASRILERIDAIESELGSLVDSLRREADRLNTALGRDRGAA
jgi:Mg2+ and Co2+ transporter CorA